MVDLVDIWETKRYFQKDDANVYVAQEDKCVYTIYASLSCAVVAKVSPVGVTRPANAVYATALKLGIIREDN